MGIEVAIGALVVSAASAVAQHSAQKKAAKAQKERGKQTEASNVVEARRARTQAAREARIKRAQVLQASERTGTAGSSGEIAAEGMLATGLAAQASQTGFNTAQARNATRTQQDIADAQAQGRTWGTVGSISGSIFSASSGSLFGGAGSPSD